MVILFLVIFFQYIYIYISFMIWDNSMSCFIYLFFSYDMIWDKGMTWFLFYSYDMIWIYSMRDATSITFLQQIIGG